LAVVFLFFVFSVFRDWRLVGRRKLLPGGQKKLIRAETGPVKQQKVAGEEE
jgi:hypothetical protein